MFNTVLSESRFFHDFFKLVRNYANIVCVDADWCLAVAIEEPTSKARRLTFVNTGIEGGLHVSV